FMDHHNFKQKDFDTIKRRAQSMDADFIITTEKDLVKLPKDLNMDNLFVLKIEFTMLEDNSLKGFGE
ncbi:MAG: tetraacyldisaccharide 4'-kinase, partial [Cetobacterium sp.]